MEYDIIVESNPFLMAKIVNEKCADGWRPKGSHNVAFEPGKPWFYSQTIVRNSQSNNIEEKLTPDNKPSMICISHVKDIECAVVGLEKKCGDNPCNVAIHSSHL